MTNVELVTQGYTNFASGNIEAVLATWDPELEWHECKGMPFVDGDGIFKGHEAIMTNVLMKLPEFFDGFNIEVSKIFGAGDRVVMEGYYRGTNKATGNTFKANAIHVWTVKDGKSTRFFQAVDTATIMS
jgi:ketosteroid isomerase-like protein